MNRLDSDFSAMKGLTMTPRCFVFLIAFVISAAGSAPAALTPLQPDGAGVCRFGPCHAQLKGDVLTIGNAEIERIWRLEENGGLAPCLNYPIGKASVVIRVAAWPAGRFTT